MLRCTKAAFWLKRTPIALHWSTDEVLGTVDSPFRHGPRYVPKQRHRALEASGENKRQFNNRWGFPKFHRGGEMWRIVDAQGQELEGLAEQLIMYITGRFRPDWKREKSMGDQIIVINCGKVAVDDEEGTPLPWRLRPYAYTTGYPKAWGVQIRRADEEYLMDPCRPMWLAIWERIPRRHPAYKLRNKATNMRFWTEKIHCFPGSEHPFKEMDPVPLQFPIETVGTEQWHSSAQQNMFIPRKTRPQGWK
eukprot:Hpha_TRINITY_DN19903_c0_g1::TRINITY_DN19903_c0_g1_i1::g.93573::m.93573/K02871/RP-L13, MRPL13, rplM; large subunit ribosomal protein L13